jgi:hypothetical protein
MLLGARAAWPTAPTRSIMDTAPTVGGNCANQQDLAIYQREGIAGFTGEVGICARKCWGAGGCVSQCFQDAKGYSKPCADCFAGLPSCTMMHCPSCISGSDPDGCNTCTTQMCLPAFAECSGLNPARPASFSDPNFLTSYESCSACTDTWDPHWLTGLKGSDACLYCLGQDTCRQLKSAPDWCSSDWAHSVCAKTCCLEAHPGTTGNCAPQTNATGNALR